MAEGYRDFTAGEVLTAANLEDYCERQGVMRFASASARNTALSGLLTEGLLSWMHDTNDLAVYSGSAWSTVGPLHGALKTWTPTVVQGATPTISATGANYFRLGRLIVGWAEIGITSSGTASNTITVALPVTVATSQSVMGAGYINDTSASTSYSQVVFLVSSTTLGFRCTTPNASLTNQLAGSGANNFNAALANGDSIGFVFVAQAAADA